MLLRSLQRAVPVLLVAALVLLDSTEQAPACDCRCPSTARQAVGASKQSQTAAHCSVYPSTGLGICYHVVEGASLCVPRHQHTTKRQLGASTDLICNHTSNATETAAIEQLLDRQLCI